MKTCTKSITLSLFITSFMLFNILINTSINYALAHESISNKNYNNLSNWKTYSNKDYHINLKYPPHWKLNSSYSDRYDGKDGFFQISALSTEETSIDKVVEYDTSHMSKPYGSKPEIEKLEIHNQEARLILPSPDQAKEMNNQAGIIIKYPNAVKIDSETYYYFVLWADKEHIHEIVKTINFVY